MTSLRYESLAGQIVLVTGASRGIGRGIALAFGEQGAVVLVNSRTHEGATNAVEAIRAAGGCAETAVADVGQRSAAEEMIAEVVARHGRLDVLVNNAAINPVVPLMDITQESWEEAQRVNEWALFHCGQPAARQMVKQGGGSIVVIGSPAVVDAYAGQSLYCASKAGLQMLAMSMAWEWGPLGVRTNVVQPGWIETELNREYLWSDPALRQRVLNVIPLRRTGLPADIGPAVLWLCSQDASYVNGATIEVDGGLLAGRPKT
ncbi:MAG: SDR family NAD(P)-dependent oxidoreductase [Acidimicrobiales bacterium]|jgi:NAD(P)-dependent dehydrogenase (short-subunit alcohol dehydrogenase family)